ncbi:phosphoesterase [Rhizobium sp. Leaf384]|uniref:DHH family phosphoesterase n=1 Tax=unclassified Rhizobium TaxID=2613769 RepID=UPI0007134049|nr:MULTISPECIES: DHH family phosphoesterase [unclassified Rhizobium]KQS75611.1 phosphoesterase [Rhizobium sp. Leaf384]KQS75860.1 phosphoesterase [Rhizobium sp. Leaf383]
MTRIQSPDLFPDALARLGDRPLIACHNDADGLSAGVLLKKALERHSVDCSVRLVGKGENAYAPAFAEEIDARYDSGAITGIIIADLGVSDQLPPTWPAILIDHHVPTGLPAHATIISGIEDDPVPTSSLLAYRCARSIGDAEPDLWLAAIGIIGDMADGSGFPEMEEARRFGITALRKAVSLVNAPRRSASGDATPAFELLAKASGPKDVLSGVFPETARLQAAQAEVRRELDEARKAAPRFAGDVAIIPISSPCQVHPVIAQTWSGRLKVPVVIAANTGYRPGWVHFAARSSGDTDLPAFLATVRPPGADEQYGKGHRAASGGALRTEDWNLFVETLGFDAEMKVATTGPENKTEKRALA